MLEQIVLMSQVHKPYKVMKFLPDSGMDTNLVGHDAAEGQQLTFLTPPEKAGIQILSSEPLPANHPSQRRLEAPKTSQTIPQVGKSMYKKRSSGRIWEGCRDESLQDRHM